MQMKSFYFQGLMEFVDNNDAYNQYLGAATNDDMFGSTYLTTQIPGT